MNQIKKLKQHNETKAIAAATVSERKMERQRKRRRERKRKNYLQIAKRAVYMLKW